MNIKKLVALIEEQTTLIEKQANQIEHLSNRLNELENRLTSNKDKKADLAEMDLTCEIQKPSKVQSTESQYQLEEKSNVSPTRRVVLKKLVQAGIAASLVGAVTVGGSLKDAQARIVVNTATSSGYPGAVIVPSGSNVTGTLPLDNNNQTRPYGLIVSNSSLNLSNLPNAPMGLYVSSFAQGLQIDAAGYALTAIGGAYGVFAQATNYYGVWAISTNSYGLVASGGLAPLRLSPNLTVTGAPTSGNHNQGELFVDNRGYLYYCYSGDGTNAGIWKQLAP